MKSKIKRDLVVDLDNAKTKEGFKQSQKNKLNEIISKVKNGDFDASKLDFPQSRLHCELLILGDVELLSQMEKGEYYG